MLLSLRQDGLRAVSCDALELSPVMPLPVPSHVALSLCTQRVISIPQTSLVPCHTRACTCACAGPDSSPGMAPDTWGGVAGFELGSGPSQIACRQGESCADVVPCRRSSSCLSGAYPAYLCPQSSALTCALSCGSVSISSMTSSAVDQDGRCYSTFTSTLCLDTHM